ncbi:PP2C family protein-serine/threonine phosphatase [Streptomyces sp. NPDC006879]|uniref:PP2C family protein-serine/threonine phosphatase n=1 Tax=Streptomyces sp. NPDC006879 TaxID=3364767 RepID=UPI0036A4F080
MIRNKVWCSVRGGVPRVRWVCILVWTVAMATWELLSPDVVPDAPLPRLLGCLVSLSLAACAAFYVRHWFLGELQHTREIAKAAQRALLRPLPSRLDGLAVAAAQLSATRGASVGGDLYEALTTPYGVRIVIGDARGHGLGALGAATAVLGSFREAAYEEPDLGGVLRRMERALGRNLRERAARVADPPVGGAGEPDGAPAEDFVTVLLLEVTAGQRVRMYNCGHPWPYRLRARGSQSGHRAGRKPVGGRSSAPGMVEPACAFDPLPPLGVCPLPAELPDQVVTRLEPGETLFLYTDGAEDARDRAGRDFPLHGVLSGSGSVATALSPAVLVAGVREALLHHTGGELTDDVALLVLRNDYPRPPAQSGGQVVRRAVTPYGA